VSLILASASPQRRAILAQAGFRFDVRPAHVEEATHGDPVAVAEANARAKAEALGVRGDVGLMARLERIILLAVAIPFGAHGSLPYAVYLLAALTAFTVGQRVVHVHRQLTDQKAEG
jgi:hypothetical protein